MDPLVEMLKTLISQSTAVFGADDPSTLKLQQQLAALLAEKEKSRKVLWIQPSSGAAAADKKA